MYTLHFHCLRKTFATKLLNQRVAMSTIANLGAWKDPETILRFYAGKDPSAERKAINDLDFNIERKEAN